jgi:hypothetical protein
MSPRAAPLLEPDLEAGLKRLKLAAVRRLVPGGSTLGTMH